MTFFSTKRQPVGGGRRRNLDNRSGDEGGEQRRHTHLIYKSSYILIYILTRPHIHTYVYTYNIYIYTHTYFMSVDAYTHISFVYVNIYIYDIYIYTHIHTM